MTGHVWGSKIDKNCVHRSKPRSTRLSVQLRSSTCPESRVSLKRERKLCHTCMITLWTDLNNTFYEFETFLQWPLTQLAIFGAQNVLGPIRRREDALSINCAISCTPLKAVPNVQQPQKGVSDSKPKPGLRGIPTPTSHHWCWAKQMLFSFCVSVWKLMNYWLELVVTVWMCVMVNLRHDCSLAIYDLNLLSWGIFILFIRANALRWQLRI